MVFYWQYVDNRVEAQGKRINCEALLNILGKIKMLYECLQNVICLQILNLYQFPSKIIPTIVHWTQENIFISTVPCNHKQTYAFCISLGSICHFSSSCLVIRVRKELSDTAVPNTMEVHSSIFHD